MCKGAVFVVGVRGKLLNSSLNAIISYQLHNGRGAVVILYSVPFKP